MNETNTDISLDEIWERARTIRSLDELVEGNRVIVDALAYYGTEGIYGQYELGRIERGRVYLDHPIGLIITLSRGLLDPANVRKLSR